MAVNVERLLHDAPMIHEPVPESERKDFVLWRGAHLGKIALNFLQGIDSISVSQQYPDTHFADNYREARRYATDIMDGFYSQQWDKNIDQALFQQLSDSNIVVPPAAVMLALDEQYNDPSFRFSSGYGSFNAGFNVGPVTYNMLDPYSREFLEEYIGIPENLTDSRTF